MATVKNHIAQLNQGWIQYHILTKIVPKPLYPGDPQIQRADATCQCQEYQIWTIVTFICVFVFLYFCIFIFVFLYFLYFCICVFEYLYLYLSRRHLSVSGYLSVGQLSLGTSIQLWPQDFITSGLVIILIFNWFLIGLQSQKDEIYNLAFRLVLMLKEHAISVWDQNPTSQRLWNQDVTHQAIQWNSVLEVKWAFNWKPLELELRLGNKTLEKTSKWSESSLFCRVLPLPS